MDGVVASAVLPRALRPQGIVASVPTSAEEAHVRHRGAAAGRQFEIVDIGDDVRPDRAERRPHDGDRRQDRRARRQREAHQPHEAGVGPVGVEEAFAEPRVPVDDGP